MKLSSLHLIEDVLDATDEEYFGAIKNLVPVGLMHDVIRSIEPGVYNPGEDGMITEVIINVPCKMTLLKLSHELDQIELDLG